MFINLPDKVRRPAPAGLAWFIGVARIRSGLKRDFSGWPGGAPPGRGNAHRPALRAQFEANLRMDPCQATAVSPKFARLRIPLRLNRAAHAEKKSFIWTTQWPSRFLDGDRRSVPTPDPTCYDATI